MRTQFDVRDALHTMADEAVTAEEFVLPTAAGPVARRRQLRRLAPVGGAVALVAAVAIAVPLLARPDSAPVRGGAATSTGICDSSSDATTSLHYGIGFAALSGLEIVQRQVCATSSHAEIYYPWHGTTAKEVGADLDVYQPGAFDPTQAEKGVPVTINGQRGYFGKIDDPHISSRSLVKSDALAWEYSPGAWAVLQMPSLADADAIPQATLRADLLRIATAVRTERPGPLRMPFRLGYLPGNVEPELAADSIFHPNGVATAAEAGAESGGDIAFGVPSGQRRCAPHAYCAPDLQISAAGNFVTNPTGTFRVNGHLASFRRDAPGSDILTVYFDHWLLEISVSHSNPAHITHSQMIDIAARTTFSGTSADDSTWFDAATSLP